MNKLKEIDLEDPQVRNTVIVGAVGVAFSLFVIVANLLLGVHPVMIFALVLSIVIVFVCVLAFINEEKKEAAAKLDSEKEEMMNQVEPYLTHAEELLADVELQLSACQQAVESIQGGIPKSVKENMEVIERIRDKLGERKAKLHDCISNLDEDSVAQAKELGESPLSFPHDAVTTVVTQARIPDMPTEQLKDAVDSLSTSIQQELEAH